MRNIRHRVEFSNRTRSIGEILSRNNIRGLPSEQNGRYYTTCPRCSANRKTLHQNLKCLGVTIDSRGVRAGCNHCDWTGGGFCAPQADRAVTLGPKISVPASPVQPQEPDRRRKAQWLYSQSVPATGTLVETYWQSRGITIKPARTIRYLPPKQGFDPAMIVPFGIPEEIEPGVITIAPDTISGVHLTRLKPDGSGKIEETEGKSAKIMLGPSRGLPLVVAPPNDLLGLAITEGIEDAASAHQLTGLGAWAAGCASRLPRLAEVVPHYIEVVTIIVDPDKDGVRYSRQFAQELRARGFYVELFQQEFAEELAA
jgi:hypothetical protein